MEKTTHAHGATHTHSHHAPHHKKTSGGMGKFIFLIALLIIAVFFWMKSTTDLDVYTNPDFNKSTLSGANNSGNKAQEVANTKRKPVEGTKMLFGTTGECGEMFAEYYATYDNAITSLKEAENPFGTAAVVTENWFDGAWTVSLAPSYVDPYGYSFTTYTSGDAKGFGYMSGDQKGGLVMFRNLSKDPSYTGTAVFATETGHFDQVQLSGFEEKFRPLIGKQAVPCLMKFKTGVCDYLYVGMIRFPDRTIHDVQCYTQAGSDVYQISSVDALNIFNPAVQLDDFSKNYTTRNKAIVWFMNHMRKSN